MLKNIKRKQIATSAVLMAVGTFALCTDKYDLPSFFVMIACIFGWFWLDRVDLKNKKIEEKERLSKVYNAQKMSEKELPRWPE